MVISGHDEELPEGEQRLDISSVLNEICRTDRLLLGK